VLRKFMYWCKWNETSLYHAGKMRHNIGHTEHKHQTEESSKNCQRNKWRQQQGEWRVKNL
jgi:hypothetical protein